MDYLVFQLGEQRHALPITQVERVVRTVEVTPLAQMNDDSVVRGFINVHGIIVPVFDLRQRKAIDAQDDMILALLPDGQRAALLCDTVEGVRQLANNDVQSTRGLLPESHREAVVDGSVIKDDAGLIHLHHLETLLASSAEIVAQIEDNEAQRT